MGRNAKDLVELCYHWRSAPAQRQVREKEVAFVGGGIRDPCKIIDRIEFQPKIRVENFFHMPSPRINGDDTTWPPAGVVPQACEVHHPVVIETPIRIPDRP